MSVNEVIKPSVVELFTGHGIVSLEFITTLKSPPKIKCLVYDYSKGDFDGLHSAVRAANLSILNSPYCSYINDWQRWKDTVLAAVADFVSTKKLKGRNPIPQINGLIINPIHKKESIHRKLRENPTNTCERNFHHSAPKSSVDFEKVKTPFSLIWKQH